MWMTWMPRMSQISCKIILFLFGVSNSIQTYDKSIIETPGLFKNPSPEMGKVRNLVQFYKQLTAKVGVS